MGSSLSGLSMPRLGAWPPWELGHPGSTAGSPTAPGCTQRGRVSLWVRCWGGKQRPHPRLVLQVRAFLQPPLKGVVMETFGSGNGPTKPDLLRELQAAAARGLLILNCTHCLQGTVTSDYAAGMVGGSRGLRGRARARAGRPLGWDPRPAYRCALSAQAAAGAGIVSGFDMTSEAALAKLSYVLGQPGLSLDDRKEVRAPPVWARAPNLCQREPEGVPGFDLQAMGPRPGGGCA